MIKDFENYRLLEDFGNMTQWEKDCGNTTARATVQGRPTRQKVRDAFDDLNEYYAGCSRCGLTMYAYQLENDMCPSCFNTWIKEDD